MNRTFSSEDSRKAKAFEAWIKYLHQVHSGYRHEDFDEFYEGIGSVSELSKNQIGFDLEDGRKLRHIPINPEIYEQSRQLDYMYVVLGFRSGKWQPLDIISIGSVLDGDRGHVHITYNPLYVSGAPTIESTDLQ